jgi:hypothetical protein
MMATVVYFISKIYAAEIRWMIHYGEGTRNRWTDEIEEY